VVKVIGPELVEGLSAERFAREVKLAARLQQANIVPVLTTGDAGGLPYYTMPFVRGESLRARLARGSVPMEEAIGILRDVAKALAPLRRGDETLQPRSRRAGPQHGHRPPVTGFRGVTCLAPAFTALYL
jgi:serine/threonine protein kinase